MLQGQEIFVILLVALVVLGPSRLPELARKLGGWTAELRKAAREIREGLEAEVSEVKKVADEVSAPMKEVSREMSDAAKFANQASAAPEAAPRRSAEPKDAETAGEDRAPGEVVDRDTAEPPAGSPPARSWIGPQPVSGPTPADAMDDLRRIEETGEPVTDESEASPGTTG